MSDLVLVTGATGFVGSAVVRKLVARGDAVRVLVRAGGDRRNLSGLDVAVADGDLTDLPSLARAVAGCRYVFHVAADYRIWVPDADAMRRVNVEGTRILMLAALAAGVERVVYCSSVAALGINAEGMPADETTPVAEADIVGVYKKSKYQAEQLVLGLVASHGLPAVIVNPAAPIGPRDVKPTPTGKMIIDAANGRMPAYLNTGLCVVHVDDVAAGHLLALEKGRVGERYILGGTNMTLAQLLTLVDEEAGRSSRRVRLNEAVLWPVAMASEALTRFKIAPLVTRDHLRMARKRMYFSSDKARRELGYNAQPARLAVRDAVGWFREAGMIGK